MNAGLKQVCKKWGGGGGHFQVHLTEELLKTVLFKQVSDPFVEAEI